jgi:hypothetical protein
MLTLEHRMVNKFKARSPIFLVFVLRSKPNHTPIKYRCLFKMISIEHLYLSVMRLSVDLRPDTKKTLV